MMTKKISKAQLKVLKAMGDGQNVLANDENNRWWIDGGASVPKGVAIALIRNELVEVTRHEGGQPGVCLFTATKKGRGVACNI